MLAVCLAGSFESSHAALLLPRINLPLPSSCPPTSPRC